tara:strand:+ start:6365 stop:6559 length:195 start_codon:yes stop_codon:yes gene_type:complete
MKECCNVGDKRPFGKGKVLKRHFWGLLILVVLGLAVADALGVQKLEPHHDFINHSPPAIKNDSK